MVILCLCLGMFFGCKRLQPSVLGLSWFCSLCLDVFGGVDDRILDFRLSLQGLVLLALDGLDGRASQREIFGLSTFNL